MNLRPYSEALISAPALAGPHRYCPPRHLTYFNPRPSSHTAWYDEARSIWAGPCTRVAPALVAQELQTRGVLAGPHHSSSQSLLIVSRAPVNTRRVLIPGPPNRSLIS